MLDTVWPAEGGVAIDIASLSSRELAGTCRVRSHMPLGHKRLELQVEARAGGDPRNGPETAAESHIVMGGALLEHVEEHDEELVFPRTGAAEQSNGREGRAATA